MLLLLLQGNGEAFRAGSFRDSGHISCRWEESKGWKCQDWEVVRKDCRVFMPASQGFLVGVLAGPVCREGAEHVGLRWTPSMHQAQRWWVAHGPGARLGLQKGLWGCRRSPARCRGCDCVLLCGAA